MKRIPLLPTLIVLIAAAIMIRLGFWQLDRLHQKEALLAKYAAAEQMQEAVKFPADAKTAEPVLYRRSEVVCQDNFPHDTPMAGENASGVPGWMHVYRCTQLGGPEATIVLGWSVDPNPREFRGGRFRGVIGPGPRLVVDPDLSIPRKLEPSAKPDPNNLPNNHLAYAVQWFAFAAVALVIYALAVRKRMRP